MGQYDKVENHGLEVCPLGNGLSCSECEAVDYSCHPSHAKRARTVKERMDKLIDDISFALKQPPCDKKVARVTLENVFYDLQEIRELIE